MTLEETIAACSAFVKAVGHEGDDGPSAEATFAYAQQYLERLRHENAEMRRTYGSHPLFAEERAKAFEEAATVAAQFPAPHGHDLATFIRFRTSIAEAIRGIAKAVKE